MTVDSVPLVWKFTFSSAPAWTLPVPETVDWTTPFSAVTICVDVRAELVGAPIWVTPRTTRVTAVTASRYRSHGRVLRERFITGSISRLRLSRTRRKAEILLSKLATSAPSEFWVSLPSGRGEAAMIACMSRSVLVVDDDPEFRDLAGRLLAASGLTVVGEADSVEAALSAAARLEPSAALVDVELPDGDGVTLARELAALPWRPRVVLTSINGEITTVDEARAAGARAFVSKAELPNAPLRQLLGGS